MSTLLKESYRDPNVKPKLAVITTFFNPMNYVNLRSNYLKFAKEIKEQADLFPIELSFDGNFFIQDENVIQIKGGLNNILWQKERLLSLALEQLPQEYTNVAWLDCDILFDNKNWVNDINSTLQRYKVAQVYEGAKRLDANGKIGKVSIGMIKTMSTMKSIPKSMIGITGFGWAIRREVIDKIKFLDTQIIGGADALMHFAFFNIKDSKIHEQLSDEWREHINEWSDRAYAEVKGSVGYVKGDITHLYHGSLTNRNYGNRYQLLKDISFDPKIGLELDKNGLWQFKNKKLNKHLSQYFGNRDEDDNIIKINNYFDNVYVLNLNRSKERLKNISTQLEHFKIDFERFEAIDGNDISDDDYDFSNFKQGHGMLENKYALACLRSHIEIVKNAKLKGYKKILVLEDDVTLDPEFNIKIQSIKNINDWKLLYFGATQYNWTNINFIDDFYLSKKSLGTYAFAIDISAFDSIINTNKEMLSVDNMLSQVQELYYGKCYTFYPNICVPDVSSSEIRGSRNQAEHSERMKWPSFKKIENYEKRPKISVVMMSYLSDYENSRSNAVEKFNRAVHSFIQQKYKNSELIIVSDGCELTNEEYKKHWYNNDRVKLVKTGKSLKKWPGSKRQIGIDHTIGDWITYLDSDDILHPLHLSNIVKNIDPRFNVIFNDTYTKIHKIIDTRKNRIKNNKKVVLDDRNRWVYLDRLLQSIKKPSFVLNDAVYLHETIDNGTHYDTSRIIHAKNINIKWEDRDSRGEDIVFSNKLMQELPYKTIESSTYIVCHIPEGRFKTDM